MALGRKAAARNLGLVMRACFGVRTPRSLQSAADVALLIQLLGAACIALCSAARQLEKTIRSLVATASPLTYDRGVRTVSFQRPLGH
jgi:hypothetical protein